MTRFFAQREAGKREQLAALAVAVGVGGLSFYLAKMLLAREDFESTAPPVPALEGGRRPPAPREKAEGR